MTKHWVKGLALPICAPLAFSACTFAEPSTGEQGAEEIIGGFPASSPQLDLVGALAFPVPEDFDPEANDGVPEDVRSRPYFHPSMESVREGQTHFTFCTGTLIAPDAVLTAEHCIADLYGDEQFVLGFDGTQPERAVTITGAVFEDTIEGGAVGLGSDVGIVFLEEPIEDVGTASIGTLEEADVGGDYVNIGYGVQNNAEESGTRFLGAVTLRGVLGNMADHLFGDFEGFLENYPELGLPEDQAEAVYNSLELIPEYEATFGHADGNAQSCFGDSGGPVMRATEDGFTVYGVTSWGLGSTELVCDWGGAYATFGPAAEDFIDQSLACGTVPAEGTCNGDVATRCAPPEEGGWEVVETDCTELGMICGTDDNQQISCIEDPCEGIPEEGMCEGDTAIRCTEEGEGNRRVVETDCSTLGMTCGADDSDQLTCVSP